MHDYAVYGIAIFAESRLTTVEDNVLDSNSQNRTLNPTAGVSTTVFPDVAATPTAPADGPLHSIDCIDYTVGGGTAGTANQWRRNAGYTAIPAGICGRD